MQNAAILWHVSLLVPPERKGLALGLLTVDQAHKVIQAYLGGAHADAA